MLLMLHNSYILSLTNIISNLNSIIISRRQFVSGKDVIHGISGERVLHVFIFIFRIVQPIGADPSRQRSVEAMGHSIATGSATKMGVVGGKFSPS